MDTVRTWVLLLCGVAVASAAVGALLPEGRSKGAFRVLTAIVFLYALVLPLRSTAGAGAWLDRILSADLPDAQALEQSAADARLLAANRALETAIADELHAAGYRDVTVRVQCAEESGGISPEKITVRGNLARDDLQQLLRPYLAAHTSWELLTED